MSREIGPLPLPDAGKRSGKRLFPALVAAVLLGACSSGPGNRLPLPPPESAPRPVEQALAEIDAWLHPSREPAEALYAGDTIAIEVKNHPEYSVALKIVPADGIVPLSGLRDESVQAIGRTPQSLEREIAEKYGTILVNPYVTVIVKGYATRVVFVSGEVRNAGKFGIPMDTRLTLLRALAEAGGLTEDADGAGIRILREDREGGRQVTSPRIDLDILYQAGIDVPLLPNDSITVPKKRQLRVSIWGKGVQRPGTYPWEDGLTVTRLVPMAGGLEKFADTSKVLILRRETDGQKTYRVDLNQVYANREPDFLLRPGDVVRIDDTFF